MQATIFMIKAKLLISLAAIACIHQFNHANATTVPVPSAMAMPTQSSVALAFDRFQQRAPENSTDRLGTSRR